MPAQGQNIIELGFNVEALDAQKKQVLDILLQVTNRLKEIDGTQLKPINLPGFSDLKTQTDAQKKAVDELSLSVKEYASIQNQRAQTDAKVAVAGSDAAKQLAEQKVQLQQVNKENKDAALAALGLTGAYKELSNQFRQASAEAKNLAAQAIIDPKFSEQAKQAAAVANELNNKLKTIDASVGDFRRNVGNYTGAITILEKSFNDIKAKMDQLNQAGKQNSTEFQSLSKQYGLLEVIVNQNAKGFSSLQQELRTNERALQTLSEQGLQNTEVFKNLQVNVANAKREFNDFARNQKLLESEAPLLTGLTVAAKGLAGAYAIGAGSVALFSDGNEKLEKELNKLVAVMTVLQGLEEAYKLIKEKSAIATALQNTAQKAWAFLTGTSIKESEEQIVAIKSESAARLENVSAIEAENLAKESGNIVGAANGEVSTIDALATAQESLSTVEETVAQTEEILSGVREVATTATEAETVAVEGGTVAQEENSIATKISVFAQKIWQATVLSSAGATAALRIALIGLTGGLLLLLPLLASGAKSGDEVSEGFKKIDNASDATKKALSEMGKTISDIADNAISSLTEEVKSLDKEIGYELPTNIEKATAALQLLNNQARDLQGKDGFFHSFSSIGDSFKRIGAAFGLGETLDEQLTKNAEQRSKLRELIAKDEADKKTKILSDELKTETNLYQQEAKTNADLVIDYNGRILSNDKSTYSQKLDALKSNLDQKRIIIQQDLNKSLQEAGNNSDRELAQNKANADLIKAQRDFADQYNKLSEEQNKKEQEAIFQLAKFREQIQADSFKKVADDQNKSLNERLSALSNYAHLEADIINKSAEHEIQVNKLTGNQALLVREKALQDIKNLNENISKQAIGINQESINDTKAQIAQFAQDQIKEADRVKNEKLAKEKELQDAIIALGDETYNKEKARRTQEEKDEADKDKLKLDAKKRLSEEEKKLAQGVVDLTETLFTDGYEREKNAIQAVEDASNERYSTEITNIQNSTLSEQDKANRITVLQAQQHQDQLRLDKEKRDIQIKEARVAKAAQAASIIATTAQAVIAALAPPPVGLGPVFGVPVAIATGAVGALQLAKVLATPIPQYAEGTDAHPGGLAVVGEGKHEELVQIPGGVSFVADKPMLLDLPLNTKVLPLTDDINEMANRAMIINTARMIEFKEKNDSQVSKMLTQTNKILSVIAKKETRNVTHVNTKVDLGWADYINKKIYGKG